MADGNYARLQSGGAGFLLLVAPPRRGRGRPKGSKNTKPAKPYTPKTLTPAVCRCGAGFMAKRPQQRFCSRACAVKESNAVAAERRNRIEPRDCAFCSRRYTPEAGNRWKHYCSADCRRKARNITRGGSTHRRRAKRYGVEHQTVNKRKVFERDGWRCYLCGCATPEAKRGTQQPDAPELDHVVPLSRGGAHTYENVRCACRRCNGAKGAKTIEAPSIAAPAPI